jgi:uncharacterized protein
MMNLKKDKDVRMWAMFCHLAAFAGYFIPFGNIVGPLVVWQIKKDESPFIDFHGREAVNFQISYTIYGFVAALSIMLLIGMVLLPLVLLIQFVFVIIAAIKANDGEAYKIPFIFRLV